MRKHERIDLSLQPGITARLNSGDLVRVGTLGNISREGAQINCIAGMIRFNIGDYVGVAIEAGGLVEPPATVSCAVANLSVSEGIEQKGLSFTELFPEQKKWIALFMKRLRQKRLEPA